MNIEGEELCDPVYVDCSVRQVGPFSGNRLKLVIDRLIRAELTPVSCSLGYMDYLPPTVDNPGEAKSVLFEVEEINLQLRLNFNSKHCRCSNVP